MGNLKPVSIPDLSRPEDHIKRVKLSKFVSSKFSPISNISDSETNKLYGPLLCHIAHEGDISEMKELIKLGINLNLTDAHGRTALHVAVATNQLQMVKLLAAYDVEFKRDFKGLLPSQLGSENEQIVEILSTKYKQSVVSITVKPTPSKLQENTLIESLALIHLIEKDDFS